MLFAHTEKLAHCATDYWLKKLFITKETSTCGSISSVYPSQYGRWERHQLSSSLLVR
ncbi:hypothetical protein J6590_065853 [Homalodisca vitripennis]|nr:hypothetical protein J6590_065853 [Homalodisca vitripennis]